MTMIPQCQDAHRSYTCHKLFVHITILTMLSHCSAPCLSLSLSLVPSSCWLCVVLPPCGRDQITPYAHVCTGAHPCACYMCTPSLPSLPRLRSIYSALSSSQPHCLDGGTLRHVPAPCSGPLLSPPFKELLIVPPSNAHTRPVPPFCLPKFYLIPGRIHMRTIQVTSIAVCVQAVCAAVCACACPVCSSASYNVPV